MKYTITNIENLTASNGNPYKRATFVGEDGSRTDKIGTFSDSPIYGMVVEGGLVEGKIEKNAKGFNNFSPFNATPQASGGYKGGGAAKAVAMKQEGIAKSMDRKEIGIRQSSVFREAIAITLAELGGADFTADEFQQRAANWKRWCFKFYDDKLTSYGTEVPFEDDGLDQISAENIGF